MAKYICRECTPESLRVADRIYVAPQRSNYNLLHEPAVDQAHNQLDLEPL
jgi:hypothetical protein